MSTAKPYIGCKISLISKAHNRYEGILYTIDTVDSTVVLAKVQCFGTEGRPTDRPTPPKNDLYEYITFRGSDIKDISLCEHPKSHYHGLPSDPAIVQSSCGGSPCIFQAQGGPFSSLRIPSYNQLAASSVLNHQYTAGLGPLLHGPPIRRGPSVEKAIQTVPVETYTQQRGLDAPQDQWFDRGRPPRDQWSDRGRPQRDQWSDRGRPQRDQWSDRGRPQRDQWSDRGRPQRDQWSDRGRPQRDQWSDRGGPQRDQWCDRPQRGAQRTRQRDPQPQKIGSTPDVPYTQQRTCQEERDRNGENRLPTRRRQGPRRRRNYRRGQPMVESPTRSPLTFETDFDFDSANAQFIKEMMEREMNDRLTIKDGNNEGEEKEEPGDSPSEDHIFGPKCYYDKAKCFFDNLSFDIKSRTTWAEERKRNVETFGVPGRFPRGRGYRGYRGRGRAPRIY